MARDHADQPMAEVELADVSKAIREQRDEIREYLADEGVDVSTWDNEADTPAHGPDRDAADSD